MVIILYIFITILLEIGIYKHLKSEHKYFILEMFIKDGSLCDLIAEFKFPEAYIKIEVIVRTGEEGINVIDAAISINSKNLKDLLKDQIKSGSTIEYAANNFREIYNEDIKKELIEAAKNVRNNDPLEKYEASLFLFKEGLSEAIPLAFDILSTPQEEWSITRNLFPLIPSKLQNLKYF